MLQLAVGSCILTSWFACITRALSCVHKQASCCCPGILLLHCRWTAFWHSGTFSSKQLTVSQQLLHFFSGSVSVILVRRHTEDLDSLGPKAFHALGTSSFVMDGKASKTAACKQHRVWPLAAAVHVQSPVVVSGVAAICTVNFDVLTVNLSIRDFALAS